MNLFFSVLNLLFNKFNVQQSTSFPPKVGMSETFHQSMTNGVKQSSDKEGL